MSALWHNQAHMPSVVKQTVRIVRGEGAYVYDSWGRRLLDVPAGLWFANVGHGRAEIAQRVERQLRELETYPVFGDYVNPRAEELADRVAALVPMDDPRVFFTSGGSDAAEIAIKLARRYWQILGMPSRQNVITCTGGYHGLHGFGTSVVGVPSFREGYGDLLPGSVKIAPFDIDALAQAIGTLGSEQIAAYLCEPVLGGGAGVVVPPDGFLRAAQDLCREHGILLILDEVITGLGRCGALFAAGRYNVRPDMMLLAKGLTSGYAPLGAVVADRRVAAPFWAEGSPHVFRQGLTYSGHAAACAAAMANLDILEREELVARVRGLEQRLLSALLPLREHPLVSDVRGGVGLLAAVAFHDHAVAEEVARAALDLGMLMRVTGGNALQISPPFTMPEAALDELPQVISAAMSRTRPPAGAAR
jgi:putrescine---pyruvate transaminase